MADGAPKYKPTFVGHLQIRKTTRCKFCSVDFLTITSTDEKGNIGMFVVVNMFSRLVFLYPVLAKNAVTCATGIFKNICIYGFVRNLYSDHGSKNTAEAVAESCKLLGMTHRLSIVNWHESNGVERPNKEILRHLHHLVNQEHAKHKWVDDTVLPIIQFIINNQYNVIQELYLNFFLLLR